MKNILFVDDFSDMTSSARKEILSVFSGPRTGDESRQVWDYWHVENQFTALRASAKKILSSDVYNSLYNELMIWGKNHLGTDSISDPWISIYINGFEQRIHADLNQGDWAFVLSLTENPEINFSGGETFIFREELLDYWNFDFPQGFEIDQAILKIKPLLNRLLVFDPRLPHGVNPVMGTYAPEKSRIVLHGWFRKNEVLSAKLSNSDFYKSITKKIKFLIPNSKGELFFSIADSSNSITLISNKLRPCTSQLELEICKTAEELYLKHVDDLRDSISSDKKIFIKIY